MFVPFKIASVNELTLGANLLLSDLQRLTWKEQSNIVKDQGKCINFRKTITCGSTSRHLAGK